MIINSQPFDVDKEFCYSGSIFTQLPANLYLYVTTSADAENNAAMTHCTPPDDLIAAMALSMYVLEDFGITCFSISSSSTPTARLASFSVRPRCRSLRVPRRTSPNSAISPSLIAKCPNSSANCPPNPASALRNPQGALQPPMSSCIQRNREQSVRRGLEH